MAVSKVVLFSLLSAPVMADQIQCETKTTKAACAAPDCRWNGRECEYVCFKYHVRWMEPSGSEDMPGSHSEDKDSTAKCQQKCKETAGCAHFSYWPEWNSCRLNSASATASVDARAFSGDPNCDEVCFSTSEKWMPLDTAHPDRIDASTPAECQEKCASISACQHFSWWLDDGCHLMSDASTSQPSNHATSGPRECIPPPTPAPGPTPQATPQPMPAVTPRPTPAPTPRPTPAPTHQPMPGPTPRPTHQPTPGPTSHPTPAQYTESMCEDITACDNATLARIQQQLTGVISKSSWKVWSLQNSAADLAGAGVAVGVVALAAVGVVIASTRRSHIFVETEDRDILLE